jgi:VCBS repeat-containing protein
MSRTIPSPTRSAPEPFNGTVLIATDGSYQYTPNAGFVGTDSFSYIVDDGNGGTNEYDIVVTVIPTAPLPAAHPGTNPTDPVIEAGVDEATGAPVGDATTSGNALDNDTGQGLAVVGVVAGLATGAQSGGVGTAIDGTFGTLTLAAEGQWTYALDDGRAATEALAPGQVAHDVFSYTIIDENGATSTTTLIVAITGSADTAAPVPPRAVADINVNDAVVEAGAQPDGTPIAGDATAQGNALANDEGQDLMVIGVAAGPLGATPGSGVGDTIRGTYGTLVLGSDGQWSYQLDDSDPATEALGQGQQATDVFSYTVQDPSGQTSTAQVFVVISGSNDEVIVVNNPPTANPDTNDGDPVIEAGIDANGDPTGGDPTASGNVLANDTDPDPGDVLTVAGIVFGAATNDQTGGIPVDPIDGTYGTLSINAQGEWTYTLDNSSCGHGSAGAGPAGHRGVHLHRPRYGGRALDHHLEHRRDRHRRRNPQPRPRCGR